MEGCLIYRARTGTTQGYKLAFGKKTSTTLAREEYVKARGPIPANHILHHKCGNPQCCNPFHMEPMIRSRLGAIQPRLQGNDHPRHKLTDAEVASIRKEKLTAAALAVKYRVSKSLIYKIRTHKRRP